MAKIGQLGARSDLEALRRSGRGKFLILAGTIATALGASLWSFTQDSGVGNPEDPAKVLIVRQGLTAGYSIVLEDAGFDAAEGTFADWERKAGEEVPDLKTSGAAAIMDLADRFGFGFVVFEGPQDIGFGELDVNMPPFEEHHRFAVISAGDFADPHEMTVNPPPSEVVRDPSVLMLQALFEQERLADTRDVEGNSLEALKLRDRLSSAIDRLDRVPKGERLAAAIQKQVEAQLVDDERAEPRPTLVGDALESLTAIALANGSILSMSRGISIVSEDGVRPDLDLAERERLWVFPAGQGRRAPCTALRGGAIDDSDSPRYTVAADGSALLLRTLSEGAVVWRLDRAPQPSHPNAAPDDGCRFTALGRVPTAKKGLDPMGVPTATGAVARGGRINGEGIVEVVTPGGSTGLRLGRLDGAKLQIPAWIDEGRLVARSRHPDGDDALHLLSVDHPDVVLTVSASAFEGADSIGAVAVGPVIGDDTGPRRLLIATAGDDPRLVYMFTVVDPVVPWFESAPLAPGTKPEERDGRPTIMTLDPAALGIRPLTHQGVARDPIVSPDGRLVAFTIVDEELDRPDVASDGEIAVVALDGRFRGMKLLTRNGLEDLHPQFMADGLELLIETRVQIPQTSWIITAARRVAVPPATPAPKQIGTAPQVESRPERAPKP